MVGRDVRVRLQSEYILSWSDGHIDTDVHDDLGLGASIAMGHIDKTDE
jgi:hypothetical protein